MDSAAGDSCYFVVTVVGQLGMFFFCVREQDGEKEKEAEGRFMHGWGEGHISVLFLPRCPATTLNASFVGSVANGLSLWSVAIKGSFSLSADGALACGLIPDPLYRRTRI